MKSGVEETGIQKLEGQEILRLRLQSELVRRCKANPRYSLRAFARALQMDFSTLSKILHGRRKLGPQALRTLAGKLGLKPNEVQAILSPLACDQNSESEKENYLQLEEDRFEVISDWYHFAILELLRVKGFKADARWVSTCLGITVPEVRAALERLRRVGMLEIREGDGKWIDISTPKTTVVTPELTSAAQKKLQRQILEKSIEAIEEVPIALRDHTAMTLAIDPAKLMDAKERIKKFRRSLSKFLSRGSPCSEVYHLSLSLYPVTRTQERK